MSDKKDWWEEWGEEDDDTEQAVAVSDDKEGELVPLEEINTRADRGAILAAVDTLLSVRTFKATQILEDRVRALEEKLQTVTLDAPGFSGTVSIGDFEIEVEDLLDLSDETLERLIACAQELLENPDLADEVKELLPSQELIGLESVQDEEDQEEEG